MISHYIVGALAVVALSCFAGEKRSPEIWFVPNDQLVRPWQGYHGALDFPQLFTPTSPWALASQRTSVFETNSYLILNISDADLKNIIADIARRKMKLAVGIEAIPFDGTCGNGYEGFGDLSAIQQVASRIKAVGGTWDIAVMDEPFWDAAIDNRVNPNGATGPGAVPCLWSPDQVASKVTQTVALLRQLFPNIAIGDMELIDENDPLPYSLPKKYANWMDAYLKATGTPLAFLQADVAWSFPDAAARVLAVRDVVTSRQIPFGVMYDGLGSPSNSQWMLMAEQSATKFELQTGYTPDQAVFISWERFPDHLLPETDSGAHTYLIDRYTRVRTQLTVNAGLRSASGKLTDSQSQPLGSAPVQVSAIPTSGSGTITSYTITGTVPAVKQFGVVGIRVNTECSCDGTNDITLYSFQYTENSPSTRSVTLDFSHGLNGWGLGPGSGTIESGPPPFSKGLHVTVAPGQAVLLNSSTFATTPGTSFTLQITARVSPSSVGSGYFVIIFLSNPDGSGASARQSVPFQPGTISLGTATTAVDGSYTLSVPVENPASYQIQASYAGTDALWPAFASTSLTIKPSINNNGVVNGASFKAEPLSPGTWFTIFGQNLGSAGQWSDPNTFSLGGASVSVCGTSAALSYNSGPLTASGVTKWQLNALMPDTVAGQTSCPVVVSVDGQSSQPAMVSIAPGILELFSFTSSVGELPIVTHADYNLVGPSSAGLSPAKAGEALVAWGTGDCAIPTISVRTLNAAVDFSGRVSPGLCQINFHVPDGLAGPNVMQISSSTNSYTLWVTP